MYMIPESIETENSLAIPIYGTNKYCWIEWNEGEDENTVLGRAYNSIYERPFLYDRFNIVPVDICAEDCYERYTLSVYEINCMKTKKKYFLISCGDIDSFEQAFHSVCIPYNMLNLYRFYSEYLCLIGTVKYRC